MGQRPPPSNYGHCHQNYEPASTNPTAESWTEYGGHILTKKLLQGKQLKCVIYTHKCISVPPQECIPTC